MYQKAKKQQGSVLLISLMLLIVVTLLTFTASETVLLQEKMASGSKDTELALQVAEAALLEAEATVRGMNRNTFLNAFSITGDAGTQGYYDGTSCDGTDANCYMNTLRDLFDNNTWVNAIPATNGVECGNGDPNCKLTGEFIIIKLGTLNATASGAQVLEAVTNQYQSQSAQVMAQAWKYKVIARGSGNNPDNSRVLISYFAQSEPAI